MRKDAGPASDSRKQKKRASEAPRGEKQRSVTAHAPVERVERWDIDKLTPYARNPRLHSAEQIDQITASMTEFGQAQLVIVDEAGEIIAGHGRVLAAEALGWKSLMVGIAEGWNEERRRKYRIVDNQLALTSSWDKILLKTEFVELGLSLDELGGYGFDLEQLEQIGISMPGMGQANGKDSGKLLDLINVTIGDPKTMVEKGDHFVLSEKHHLLCSGVIDQWSLWLPLLEPGALFCPYPGVFVPFSEKAKEAALIMVQPDPYIAGHILDRYIEVYGESAVSKK